MNTRIALPPTLPLSVNDRGQPLHRAAGFSLIEILISITLGLLVIVALTTLFTRNSRSRTEIDNVGQQIENGRYAMQILRDDLRLAGFYGEFGATSAVTWQLPIDLCSTSILGWNAASLLAPVPLSGVEGSNIAALAGMSCLSNRKAHTDVLVVRRTSTTALLPSQAVANTPYLQVSLETDQCFPVDTAFLFSATGLPASFTLHKKDCSTLSVIRQYLQHTYYVSTCDVCTPTSDGIPTLKRMDLTVGVGGLAMTSQSLVQGIDDLRVDYGIDNNLDGYPDTYKKCTAADLCTVLDYANVMAVKVYVMARQISTVVGYHDDKVYSMGLAGSVGPNAASGTYNDPTLYSTSFKRHVFSQPVRLVGPSNLRELP